MPIFNKNHRRQGSILVDSAICIPIFAIAVGMLVMAINIMRIEEKKTYQMLTEVEGLSVLPGVDFTVDRSDDYLYIDNVRYDIKILNTKFPFKGAFFKSVLSEITMPYRPFIGESDDIYRNQVLIFPKNEGNEVKGPKYHTSSDCRAVKASYTKGYESVFVQRKEAVSRGYTPCKICANE